MMTFEEFCAAFQALAERDGATDPGVPYCDPESLHDLYDDGLSPEDAWSEECRDD